MVERERERGNEREGERKEEREAKGGGGFEGTQRLKRARVEDGEAEERRTGQPVLHEASPETEFLLSNSSSTRVLRDVGRRWCRRKEGREKERRGECRRIRER